MAPTRLIALFPLLFIGGKQFHLGRRKYQSVADQPNVADPYPAESRPTCKAGGPAANSVKSLAVAGWTGRLPDAAVAVGIIEDDADAACGPAPPAQFAAGFFHQAVQGFFQNGGIVAVDAEFVIGVHDRRFLPCRQHRRGIDPADEPAKKQGTGAERHLQQFRTQGGDLVYPGEVEFLQPAQIVALRCRESATSAAAPETLLLPRPQRYIRPVGLTRRVATLATSLLGATDQIGSRPRSFFICRRRRQARSTGGQKRRPQPVASRNRCPSTSPVSMSGE